MQTKTSRIEMLEIKQFRVAAYDYFHYRLTSLSDNIVGKISENSERAGGGICFKTA